jgi:hypothetical protein
MKKLFTIACTLVLGGALSFAQAGSTTQNPPASGDQTKTGTSTTKKHKHGGKKSKKNKKSMVIHGYPGGLMQAAFFSSQEECFPFSSFSA